MARKRGLGRGLGALIPNSKQEKKPTIDTKKPTDEKKTVQPEPKKTAAKPSKNTTTVAKPETKAAASAKAATKAGKTSQSAGKASSTSKTANTAKTSANSTKRKAKEESKLSATETVLRSMQHLALDQIEPNPDQPRKNFEEASLAELTESIRTYGVLQPIVVEKYTAPGHAPYRIIAGERRYRAASNAGLKEIPVVLREDRPEEQMLLSVVENVQRQDLSPVEEAVAYQHIMEERHMTQQELSVALGKSRPYIANAVRLLRLDEASLEALREGKLTSSQARTLLAEKDLKKRAAYLKLLTEGRASVQEVENRRKKPKTTDAFLVDVERRFSEALETPVAVISRRKGWSVQIACYNEEDLNRLLERFSASDQH